MRRGKKVYVSKKRAKGGALYYGDSIRSAMLAAKDEEYQAREKRKQLEAGARAYKERQRRNAEFDKRARGGGLRKKAPFRPTTPYYLRNI